jgi:hypothetical protein
VSVHFQLLRHLDSIDAAILEKNIQFARACKLHISRTKRDSPVTLIPLNKYRLTFFYIVFSIQVIGTDGVRSRQNLNEERKMEILLLEFDDQTKCIGDSSFFIAGKKEPEFIEDDFTLWRQYGTYQDRPCEAYWYITNEEGKALLEAGKNKVMPTMFMISFFDPPPGVSWVEVRLQPFGSRRGDINLLEIDRIARMERGFSDGYVVYEAAGKYESHSCNAQWYFSEEIIAAAGDDILRLPFRTHHVEVVLDHHSNG